MIKQKEFVSIHSDLTNLIEKVFTCAKLLEDAKENKHICYFYTFSLEIFSWLSKKVTNFVEYQKYKDQFISVLGTKCNLNESKEFEFEEPDEIRDHINYINVWMQNNYQVNFEQISKEELSEKFCIPVVTESSIPKPGADLATYKNIFNFKKLDSITNSDFGEGLNKLIEKTHAFDKLKHSVDGGELYIYLTKPPLNVRIKKFLLLLLGIGIFICAVLVAFILATIGKLQKTLPKDQSINLYLDLCIFIFSCIFFSLSSNFLISGFDNDNYKYTFDKKLFRFYFLFSFVFLFLINSKEDENVLIVKTPDVYDHFTLALHLIIMLNFFIYVFSYMYLNPKKNMPLIEEFISKHSSEK